MKPTQRSIINDITVKLIIYCCCFQVRTSWLCSMTQNVVWQAQCADECGFNQHTSSLLFLINLQTTTSNRITSFILFFLSIFLSFFLFFSLQTSAQVHSLIELLSVRVKTNYLPSRAVGFNVKTSTFPYASLLCYRCLLFRWWIFLNSCHVTL